MQIRFKLQQDEKKATSHNNGTCRQMLQGSYRLRSSHISHQIFHIPNYRQQFQNTYTGNHNKVEYSKWVTYDSMGIMALQLRIADFKFAHHFIICDRLPDMEILFGIDIQKNFPCQMSGIRKRTVTYRRTTGFSPTPETVEQKATIGLSSQLSKYHQHNGIVPIKIRHQQSRSNKGERSQHKHYNWYTHH